MTESQSPRPTTARASRTKKPALALNLNDVEPVSDVDVVDIEPVIGPPDNPFFMDDPEPVKLKKEPLVEKPKRVVPPVATKAPPSVDEWQKFFAKIVIRGLTSGYLWLVLRDIEDELSPGEREMIRLQEDELMELSAPFASFSAKSKFMTKYGRSIVAFADSYESFIGLWFWMRRVNKVAKRHRKTQPIPGYVMSEEPSNGPAGPNDGYYPPQQGFYSGGSGA